MERKICRLRRSLKPGMKDLRRCWNKCIIASILYVLTFIYCMFHFACNTKTPHLKSTKLVTKRLIYTFPLGCSISHTKCNQFHHINRNWIFHFHMLNFNSPHNELLLFIVATSIHKDNASNKKRCFIHSIMKHPINSVLHFTFCRK